MSDTNLPGGETPEQTSAQAEKQPNAPLQPGSSAQPPQPMQPPTLQPPAAQQAPTQQAPAPLPQSGLQPPTAQQQFPTPTAQASGPQIPAPSAPGAPIPPAPPAPPQGGAPYAQQPAQQQAPMNALSIVSFVGSFFVSLVGIICGHIALGQIKKTGERGRGFALAGTIIGYVALAGTILSIILFFAALGTASTIAQNSLDELEQSTQELTPTTPSTDPLDDTDTDDPESGSANGALSPEFCKALDDYMMLTSSSGGVPSDEEYVSALEKIAAFPSPNQAEYEKGVELLRDPAKMGTEEGQQMLEDFSTAAGNDWVACM